MSLETIRKLNSEALGSLDRTRQHKEGLAAHRQTQETFVNVFREFIQYLEKRTSKSEVVNFPGEISTPDIDKAVEALHEVHDTLKQHENTDLSEVTEVMRGVLAEIKAVPKEQPKFPEIPKFPDFPEFPEQIDYKEEFGALKTKLDALTKALEEKNLHVEAPNVHVDAPDLKPIEKAVQKLKGAEQELPVKDDALQTYDLSGLIKEQFNDIQIDYIMPDEFDDEDNEPKVGAVKYYMGKKLVGSIKLSYKGKLVTRVRVAS
jgi:hypothetical protein